MPIPNVGAASFLVPARSEQAELLDLGAGTLAEARANLNEMWRLNQAFGGLRALTAHLLPELTRVNQPVRVADLGTGSGRLATFLTDWARENKRKLRVYPLDLSARNLSVAWEHVQTDPDIQLIQADASALPFAPDAIDYYVSSLFLHHLTPDALVKLLRDTYRNARRGIVMSDIVRGYLPLAAFRLIQPLFARQFLTRHDGLLSIRRAYTPDELSNLAREAGIANAVVTAHFPWRMTLTAVKHV